MDNTNAQGGDLAQNPVQTNNSLPVQNSTGLVSPPPVTAISSSESKVNVEEISPGIFRATSKKSKYIIEYDKTKCIGAASCAAIAPLTFFMDEENKAQIIKDSVDFDEDEVILASAQSCPVLAIKIIEKDSGKIIFPIE